MHPIRILLGAGLLLSLVGAGSANAAPAAEVLTATLQVRVVDAASGEPIENAEVLIVFPELGARAGGYTDAQGLYDGSGIEWDTARVRVTRAPYRYEWYDEGDDYASATPIALEAGAITTITVELDKGTGSIAGAVRDKATGLPVEGVDVFIDDYTGLEHPDSDSGRFGVTSARTDENGRANP